MQRDVGQSLAQAAEPGSGARRHSWDPEKELRGSSEQLVLSGVDGVVVEADQ